MKRTSIVLCVLGLSESATIAAGLSAAVSATPCAHYLETLGTDEFDPLSDAIIQYVSGRDTRHGLGSGANIIDYVGAVCRLHETFKVEGAIAELFSLMRAHRLPPIPIGGATNNPKDRADADAFDQWLHHKGPRPPLR